MSTELFYRDDHGVVYTEPETLQMFDDMLNEVYEVTKMGELTWYPSDLLQKMDPVAYRCYFSDFTADFEEVTASELDEDEED